ncbi:unnamed protein product [Cuscuta epithymum]|uniref:Uncharacterized protein n=1 Tax=Cuscuta epithymum TaxID=186058 RepID=A0AAV0F179_9ASTE|nr:unnamed protein product [Cuscuta epithymum]
MAQLERNPDSFKNTKSPTTPFEQFIQGDHKSWSPTTSPTQKCYDLEEAFPNQQNKKSVLTKVKEKAKKLRHSLSGRRKQDNQIQGENNTPSWGVNLEDEEEVEEEDEDPEYLGAPMYESELAPEDYKETSRQHPRADPLFSEKNILPSQQSTKQENENESESGNELLEDGYNMKETQNIDSKFSELSVATTNTVEKPIEQERKDSVTDHEKQKGVNSPTTWDKGVSMKEYFMNKLEPGEDEKELSKVISDAMSPRRREPGERGVVDKVKDVVTSFLPPTNPSLFRVFTSNTNNTGSLSPQTSISNNNGNLSPLIPISTNAHEVLEEQTNGRVLQTN